MLDLIYDRTEADVAAGDTDWVPTWLQGTLGASGQQFNSTTRCRSGGFQQFSAVGGVVGIYVPDGWKMSGRRYTTAAASGFDQTFPTGAWIRGSYLLSMPPGRYYRFVLAKEDDTTLTPAVAETSGVTFTVFNAKGRYGFADLNRVEAAVGELRDALNAAGWNMSLITKTDWQAASAAALAQDVPSAADMARYLNNVAVIRGALAVYGNTPAVPDSMELLTWQKANAIEKILADAEELINNMLAARFYSGEVYAGEV